MIILIDQTTLQTVVHDPDLRRHLTQATEYVSPENVERLREYLVHAGYATKIAASSHDSAHTPADFARPEEPEADE